MFLEQRFSLHESGHDQQQRQNDHLITSEIRRALQLEGAQVGYIYALAERIIRHGRTKMLSKDDTEMGLLIPEYTAGGCELKDIYGSFTANLPEGSPITVVVGNSEEMQFSGRKKGESPEEELVLRDVPQTVLGGKAFLPCSGESLADRVTFADIQPRKLSFNGWEVLEDRNVGVHAAQRKLVYAMEAVGSQEAKRTRTW